MTELQQAEAKAWEAGANWMLERLLQVPPSIRAALDIKDNEMVMWMGRPIPEYAEQYALKTTASVSSTVSEKTETPEPLVLDGVIQYRDVDGEYRALRERLSLTPDDCRRIVDVARWAE